MGCAPPLPQLSFSKKRKGGRGAMQGGSQPLKRNSPRGLCLNDRSNREVKKRPPEKKFVL